MRVLVFGSRHWKDREAIRVVFKRLPPGEHTIVHGGCRGADLEAAAVARELGWPEPEEHRANWETFGKAAGPLRNQRMADSKPELCIGFDVRGSGSRDMLNRIGAANLPVWIEPDSSLPVDREA